MSLARKAFMVWVMREIKSQWYIQTMRKPKKSTGHYLRKANTSRESRWRPCYLTMPSGSHCMVRTSPLCTHRCLSGRMKQHGYYVAGYLKVRPQTFPPTRANGHCPVQHHHKTPRLFVILQRHCRSHPVEHNPSSPEIRSVPRAKKKQPKKSLLLRSISVPAAVVSSYGSMTQRQKDG